MRNRPKKADSYNREPGPVKRAPAFDRSKLILVGRILKSHGVRGELKMLPETDDPDRLLELDRVFVGADENTAVEKGIRAVRFQQVQKGRLVLIDMEDVDSRELADAFRGALVFALEDELPELASDEFYWHDLIGFTVKTPEYEVGTLKDALEMPAQRLLIVKRDGKPDAMIPAVPEFIENIDTDAREIVIRPIEGLLDD